MREKNKKTIIQAGIVIVALLIGGIIGATAQSNLFSGKAEPQETTEGSITSVAIVSSVVPASRQTVRPDNALPSAEATMLLSEPTTTATSADAATTEMEATEMEAMEAADETETAETEDAEQNSTATASPTATEASATQATDSPQETPSPSAETASETSAYGKPISRVSYSLDEVESYSSYRVQEGDTIASISERGGTTPELLMQYNRLDGEAHPGRELIIPKLMGHTSVLTEGELVVLAGNTQKPWIALTIDCGLMNEHTTAILDILEEEDAQSTFFMHGDVIGDESAELLQRIVDDGHELGSHSFDHPDFTTLTDEEIVDQLLRTEEILQEVVGEDVPIRPYFRFPFGAFDDRTRQTVIETGYLPISWTIDNYGTNWYGQEKMPTDMVERLKAASEEEMTGGIILTHCMAETVEELPGMIDVVHERGYEFHTLSEVLGP